MVHVDTSIPVKGLPAPRLKDWKLFKEVRHQLRTINGGAGQCRDVSFFIELFYAWPRVEGVYLTPEGEVCCSNHWWNILPGQIILDCTSDQFGEGDDMRLIPPGGNHYDQYDEEWTTTWNPSVSSFNPKTRSPLRTTFSGLSDFKLVAKNFKEKKRRWWITDVEQMKDYCRKQIVYAEQSGNKWKLKESYQYTLSYLDTFVVENKHG